MKEILLEHFEVYFLGDILHIKYYLLYSGPFHSHGFISDYFLAAFTKEALVKGECLVLLCMLGMTILKDWALLEVCGVKLMVATR